MCFFASLFPYLMNRHDGHEQVGIHLYFFLLLLPTTAPTFHYINMQTYPESEKVHPFFCTVFFSVFWVFFQRFLFLSVRFNTVFLSFSQRFSSVFLAFFQRFSTVFSAFFMSTSALQHRFFTVFSAFFCCFCTVFQDDREKRYAFKG